MYANLLRGSVPSQLGNLVEVIISMHLYSVYFNSNIFVITKSLCLSAFLLTALRSLSSHPVCVATCVLDFQAFQQVCNTIIAININLYIVVLFAKSVFYYLVYVF